MSSIAVQHALINPQANEWGHFYDPGGIFECTFVIYYPNYLSYYEFVGVPVLHILVDFHREPPVDNIKNLH